MRKDRLLTGVLLIVVAFGPLGLANEDVLTEWARARWESYIVASPQELAQALHPEGGTVFMGTPWDGFYYGEDAQEPWSHLQDWMSFEALEMETDRVLPAGNLAWGALTVSGTVRDTDEAVDVEIVAALVFDAEGMVVAEDVIVRSGLPSDSPAPNWEASLDEDAYPHHLRETGTGMDLWWRNGLAVLLVGVRAPGTGWVSVGFDPDRRMQGADFIIGAVSGGAFVVEDHHGHAPTAHRADRHKDILAGGGEIVDGAVTMQVIIPLDSGDPDDSKLVPGATHTALLAYHRTATGFTARHTGRSATTITLDE